MLRRRGRQDHAFGAIRGGGGGAGPRRSKAEGGGGGAGYVVIVGAKRTALGSLLGQFTGVPTPVLGATAIKAAMAKAGIDGEPCRK